MGLRHGVGFCLLISFLFYACQVVGGDCILSPTTFLSPSPQEWSGQTELSTNDRYFIFQIGIGKVQGEQNNLK